VEGVFSSSMYASSNQMCKREPPKAGHQLFISHPQKLAVGCFHWAENGGTGRSTPSVRCTGVSHVSFLNLACQILTATCNTPDALQVHTGRVRCTPDSCAESLSNSRPHRTLGTGRSGAHRTRAQRGLQKLLTPDANHRTLSECVRCSTLAGSSTPDAEASVRCLRTQRPVSVSQ